MVYPRKCPVKLLRMEFSKKFKKEYEINQINKHFHSL